MEEGVRGPKEGREGQGGRQGGGVERGESGRDRAMNRETERQGEGRGERAGERGETPTSLRRPEWQAVTLQTANETCYKYETKRRRSNQTTKNTNGKRVKMDIDPRKPSQNNECGRWETAQ